MLAACIYVLLILVAELYLCVHIGCALTNLRILLRQSLEYASAICFLDPLNLNRLKGTTANYLIDAVNDCYGCAILKLLDNWASLCHKTK